MSFDPLADATVAAVFAALSVSATYQPVLGPAAAVRIVPRAADLVLGALGGQAVHDGFLGEVQASALPVGAPAEGDGLIVGPSRYRIRSARFANQAHSVWLLDCVPA